MHPDWAIHLASECEELGTPFFFKQWGEYREYNTESGEHETVFTGTVDADVAAERAINPVWLDHAGNPFTDPDNLPVGTPCRLLERVGKKRAGRELLGRIWNEFPNAPEVGRQ
jgi:protein gp37